MHILQAAPRELRRLGQRDACMHQVGRHTQRCRIWLCDWDEISDLYADEGMNLADSEKSKGSQISGEFFIENEDCLAFEHALQCFWPG